MRLFIHARSFGLLIRAFLFTERSKTGGKVVHAALWMYLQQSILVGSQVVRTAVLARLLTPAVFGIFGIAMLAMRSLETVSATGFAQALIQRPSAGRGDLDTAWTLTVIRSFILASILYFAADAVAGFYETPAARPVIRAIAVCVLLRGFDNVGLVNLKRNLQFARTAVYEIACSFIGLAVTILAAFALRNEWALVIGMLVGMAAHSLGSYLVVDYRPVLTLEWSRAKSLYGFGFWIFAAAVTEYLAEQGDKIVMAKLLSVEALGFYTVAFSLSRLPGLLIGVVARVLFPAFCAYQHQPDRLKNHFIRTLRIIPSATIPLCVMMAVLSTSLVRWYLGEKWLPSAPLLQLLAMSMLIRTIGSSAGALFNATGHPEWSFYLLLARTTALAVLVYPLTVSTGWGMRGTACAVLFSTACGLPVMAGGLHRFLRLGAWAWLRALWAPVLASLVMAVWLWYADRYLIGDSLVGLLGAAIVGIAMYAGLLGWFVVRWGYALREDLLLIRAHLPSR